MLNGGAVEVAEEHLEELAALAASGGALAVGSAFQRRAAPDPATFVGRGKAEEIGKAARELGADLVIFDEDLSGSQTKNLEKLLALPVLDRSALILEIFSQRAQSSEARTQVELARSKYQLPRLTRAWGHLSRQEGGIGVRGGEGETQLEADRRVLRQRIRRLERDLGKIERTRAVQRGSRERTPTVALTGYTNAGKSTLFNALTRGDARAEDRLFATLDSKSKRGQLGGGREVVFSDTVGFIRKLPHHLVASFRSTLSEVANAEVVLHVIDRSHPRWQEQARVAEDVLEELGIAEERVLRVYNKSDRVDPGEGALPGELWVSARSGAGLEALRRAIGQRLPARRPRLQPAPSAAAPL